MKTKVTGFTLIELVVVITILGILAAFAVPKFVALDTQARIATMNGLAGTVKSAAELARGLSMATSNPTGPIVMEGTQVTLSNNYPASSAAGIANAINTSVSGTDFTFTPGNGTSTAATWTKVGAATPAQCSVTYTPAGVGSTPTVAVVTTGC